MKEIAYSKSASRVLARMPKTDSLRIRQKVAQYAVDPSSLAANVKKLQGRLGYRMRVGDWRVIFDETETVIDIEEIGSRGSIYE